MSVRYYPGLSYKAAVLVERRAGCALGEHRMVVADPLADPKYYRCEDCGAYGFIRRKGGVHRNGRMVLYTCSEKGCTRPARIRSKYRHTGGAFEWACGPVHAKGSKFEGRVTDADYLVAAAE